MKYAKPQKNKPSQKMLEIKIDIRELRTVKQTAKSNESE